MSEDKMMALECEVEVLRTLFNSLVGELVIGSADRIGTTICVINLKIHELLILIQEPIKELDK